jgi:hypothetical protein
MDRSGIETIACFSGTSNEYKHRWDEREAMVERMRQLNGE